MNEFNLTILLAGVIAGAAPIVLAALGETITEKAGVINLSLDGTILLSAMTAFVVSLKTGHTVFGFMAGSVVGGLIAGVVAVFGIYLKQSQVAVGFVLTLTARDLAYFLGNAYSRVEGPQVLPQPIFILEHLPFFGQIFFRHNLPVYLSLVLIILVWWYIYRTPRGLEMISVGENPAASFARGFNPKRLQLLYASAGGLFVGLAGATFSLSTKPGWGRPQGAEGTGWIALALVIFGGWNPVKAAAGAYIFSFLQIMGIYFQGWFPAIPAQVFQVAPFPIMIFTLMIMHFAQKEKVLDWTAEKRWLRRLIGFFAGAPPAYLGRPHQDP